MMKTMRRLPIFASLFFLLLSVPLTVILATQQRLSFFSKAGLGDQAQMWLWPAQVELRQDEVQNIEVILKTNQRQSGGVDLVLRYDPQMVEIVANTIQPGVVFDYYRDRLVDNRRGLIRLSAKGSFQGQGSFANFEIRGLQSGQTQIEIVNSAQILDSTVVWDQNEAANILGRSDNTTVTVF